MTKKIEIPANFKQVTIRWPNRPGVAVMRGTWKRLPDGRIEATYTREEMELFTRLDVFGIARGA